MIAPSSIIQPIPITIGPAMANIVALGWTIVPGTHRFRTSKEATWKFGHTRSYGDVTFEFNILTNDGFRMKCELVASVTFFKESKLLIRVPHRRDSQHIGGIGFSFQVIERQKRLFVLDWQEALNLGQNGHWWKSRYGLSDWEQLQYASPSSFLPMNLEQT